MSNGGNDVYRRIRVPFSQRCLTTLHYKREKQRQGKLIMHLIFTIQPDNLTHWVVFIIFVSVFDKIWNTELTFNKARVPHCLFCSPRINIPPERGRKMHTKQEIIISAFHNAENEGHKVFLWQQSRWKTFNLFFFSLTWSSALISSYCKLQTDRHAFTCAMCIQIQTPKTNQNSLIYMP